jgi:hypothetical protein
MPDAARRENSNGYTHGILSATDGGALVVVWGLFGWNDPVPWIHFQ